MRTMRVGGVATLSPPMLDASNAETARLFVEHVVTDEQQGLERLVLDLAGTAYVDSTGLGFLIATRARCLDLGATFELTSVPVGVHRTIVLSGLAEILGVGSAPPAVLPLPEHAILPALADPKFDQIAELTRRAVDAPSAFVSLVTKDGETHPGAAGRNMSREATLEQSYCRHVVSSGTPLIVTDAREHELTRTSPSVDQARAYAGMPLLDLRGNVIGSLCVVDEQPRQWTPAQLETLADLAAVASSELQLRMSMTDAAVAADRERIAADLRGRVINELLSLSMVLGSARSISSGQAGLLLDEAAVKLDDVLKSLRGTIFDRRAAR